MTNRVLSKSVLALSMLMFAGAVTAAAADQVTARQKNFKQVGGASKAMADEFKKAQPSVQVLQANAKTIAALAPQVPRWFPKGSGPESGAKTKALPLIWQNTAGFNKAAGNFAAAARNLNAAAATGDAAKIRTAFTAVGGTCKGCHDTFRSKDRS